MTTAPTYGAWNTRNGVSAKKSVTSVISRPNRRSGLSDPYRAIASAYGRRRNGAATSTPLSFQTSVTISSASVMMSSWSTKLISMSSWVNSGCLSARKSSSR